MDQEASAVAVVPSALAFTALGDTATLVATVSDANGHVVVDAEVTWSSADSGIAGVAANGLVTSVANGATTISATAGSVSAEVSVRVETNAGADRDALVTLYGATDGENWANNANRLSDRPLALVLAGAIPFPALPRKQSARGIQDQDLV
ncbi:Ig-like domain-containing protein [Candidatus Palauibacter sp.]|uniref:Ig-like domain-containing protein n=1 Tax=Candidatus Palauibacter sp. TaxID=3101350 RepID=UPI003B51A7FD